MIDFQVSMRRFDAILGFAAVSWLGVSAVLASDPGAAAEGTSTNDLIFKKRIRRRYEAQMIVEPPAQAPTAPSSQDAGFGPQIAPAAPVRVDPTDFSKLPNFTPPPVRLERARRAAKNEEDDWTLTPEERLARELKRISGIEDEEEETEDDNWMARGVLTLAEEQKAVREKAEEDRRAEEEAEQIAGIIGRDLFANLKNDPTTTRIFSGDDRSGRVPRPSLSTSTAPTTAVGSREPAGRTDAPRSEPPRGESRASAVRKTEPDRTERVAGTPGSGPEPKTASDTPGTDISKSRSGSAMESPSVAPSLFNWSSSSGPGFAGLPSSLAPSVAPLASSPSAAPAKSPVSPTIPSLSASPAPMLPSAASSPSWPPSHTALSSPGGPPSAAPAARSGPAWETVRTPFLNNTPPIGPTRVSPPEVLRRP